MKGEAKVTKSKFPNAISIKNINPEINVCKSEKFRFQITSYALTSKSIIKVQFADNYDFYNATSTIAEIDKNNIVSVSLPNWVAEGKRVYYRVVSENPNLTSIYQEIYVASKPTHIELNYNFSNDELSLYFRQYVNNTSNFILP